MEHYYLHHNFYHDLDMPAPLFHIPQESLLDKSLDKYFFLKSHNADPFLVYDHHTNSGNGILYLYLILVL